MARADIEESKLAPLRIAGDQNLVAAFQRLIPHYGSPIGQWRTFGGATAIVSGMPAAFYNPILAFDPAVAAPDVRAATAWSGEQGVMPSVQVQERLDGRIRGALVALGFRPAEWVTPAMALRLAEVERPPAPLELEVRTVDSAGLEDWHSVFGSGPHFRRAFGATMVADPDVRLITGYVEDRPVTCAAAIGSPGTVGIYAVATAEAARRRGYGQAITWAAIAAGAAAWGSKLAVLQSSEMGLGVYRSMGFAEVGRYVTYEKPA